MNIVDIYNKILPCECRSKNFGQIIGWLNNTIEIVCAKCGRTAKFAKGQLNLMSPKEEIYCPVCGYCCIGNGGWGCIDKPKLLSIRNINSIIFFGRACGTSGQRSVQKLAEIERKKSMEIMDLAKKIYWMAVTYERSNRQTREGRTEIFADIAKEIKLSWRRMRKNETNK